jgi:hypothetical protein
MTSRKIPASAQRAALWIEDDQVSSSESGVRPVCMSDELDRAFEKLESGAPPCGLIGVDDPLAQIESRALLRHMAREQLRALQQRMDELTCAPADGHSLAALRPLLDSVRTLLEALEPTTLATPLSELDSCFASAAELATSSSIDGSLRASLLSAYARLACACSRVLGLQPEQR